MAAAFAVGSWPCTTFALIWFSVSEIDCAPCRATLTVALPRASELLIDWKPAMSPRWPWAIAKVEASSAAPATLRPELMRFCVVVSDCCVRLRVSRAASALVFVLTEKLMVVSGVELQPGSLSAGVETYSTPELHLNKFNDPSTILVNEMNRAINNIEFYLNTESIFA